MRAEATGIVKPHHLFSRVFNRPLFNTFRFWETLWWDSEFKGYWEGSDIFPCNLIFGDCPSFNGSGGCFCRFSLLMQVSSGSCLQFREVDIIYVHVSEHCFQEVDEFLHVCASASCIYSGEPLVLVFCGCLVQPATHLHTMDSLYKRKGNGQLPGMGNNDLNCDG